jgi:hypothetical protein
MDIVAAPEGLDGETAPITGHENTALQEPVFGRRNLAIAGILFLFALGILFALERAFHLTLNGVSGAPHYVYQAWSFLHGRWNLDLPAKMTDIIVLHGQHFIVYPPMPAILMLPGVAIFGLSFSDILFTTLFSALNLPLLFLLFEQVRANGLTHRSWREHVIFSVALYFGSINLWLSLGGEMWFTAHILCFTFTLLAMLMAFRRHYAWAAVLLGSAFFCRATVALGFPFLYYLAWQDAGSQQPLERFIQSLWRRRPDWSQVPWRRLIPPLAVTAAVVLLFLARNQAVFGSPLESGYDILIKQRYPAVTNGPFNISYVPANIVANFFTFPLVTFTGPFDRHPVLNVLNNRFAISVFLTTPLFFYLFWRNRRFNTMRVALWITIGFVVIAVLLFHASGWEQFGARYLFDGYTFAFLLLVLNDVRVDWRFIALAALAIGFNILGALQFWMGYIPHL